MGRKRDQPGELPQGVLTFLLTDIEGSTPLWERHGADMGATLARRDAAASHLQAAVRAHDRMGAPLLLARSRRELAGSRQP